MMKKRILLGLVSLLALMMLAINVQADDWGTLFFSQSERAQLRAQSKTASPASAVSTAPVLNPSPDFYNGYLQGPRQQTHWVDGQSAPKPRQLRPGERAVQD
ncbi:hypothetical protein ABHF33_06190 [Chitinibacter sp. FCG-7]|uniref:DUF4124 domain-containing protein n=1 Tax=Chitinibacter mangrovi TaxID=3153927 RepID=A0AAU7FCS5_9NEIS